MIIGLDVSTSIVGVCVLSELGEVIEFDHINLKKIDNLYSKNTAVNQKLLSLLEKYDNSIKHIVIEKPFEFFNSGSSTAATMSKLQRFNGMVSWAVYYLFEKEPIMVEAKEARKLAGIKVPRGSNAKQIVLEHIQNTEEKFVIERTAKGNPRDYFYDMADAIVVAKAGSVLIKTGKA